MTSKFSRVRKFLNLCVEIQCVEFLVQANSCNSLRLLDHVEKLNAGQGSLFLTDIVQACVEQTLCYWILVLLSESLVKQRARDHVISITKTMSYIKYK
jgi:hypothetical protein